MYECTCTAGGILEWIIVKRRTNEVLKLKHTKQKSVQKHLLKICFKRELTDDHKEDRRGGDMLRHDLMRGTGSACEMSR